MLLIGWMYWLSLMFVWVFPLTAVLYISSTVHVGHSKLTPAIKSSVEGHDTLYDKSGIAKSHKVKI